MSYLEFHLYLILPPILLMAVSLPQTLYQIGGKRAQWALPLIAVVAFSYTTPWDNYLVANNVWWYGENRVLATIGYVPIEEYLFFVLQPILTGLFLFHVLSRWKAPPQPTSRASVWGGFLTFHPFYCWVGTSTERLEPRAIHGSRSLLGIPPPCWDVAI